VLKLHSRRVTALEFHPARSSLLVSGDKRGQLALWSHAYVTEKTVVERGLAHQWLISAIRFLPSDLDYLYSSSVDGTVVKTHCDTAQSLRVGNLNPGMVWTDDESQDWRSAYSMDVDASRNALLVGDDMGQVHLVDPRASSTQGCMQAAKRRNKIVSVSCNSVDSNLFCVAGNDHFARVWDVRRVSTNGASSSEAGLTTAQSNKALSLALATMAHPRVVSSALFSPVTGRKMLTTCTDNRLRVWDNLASCNGPPAQEIVHSHDFSRYLSPFRAVWDPKDLTESCVAVGRYISEDFGGTALHPIDIFSASTGRAMCVLTDINVQTICPVVAICPSHDIIAVGSSRNLFVWEPVPPEDEADGAVRLEDEARGRATQAAAARYAPRMLDLDEGKKKGGKKARDDDDDDDDEPFGKKKGKRE
jgi:DNA damage-binding protein 2